MYVLIRNSSLKSYQISIGPEARRLPGTRFLAGASKVAVLRVTFVSGNRVTRHFCHLHFPFSKKRLYRDRPVRRTMAINCSV
jgi:hypothetical protein